jgi:YHS domain-containing protein
VIRFLLLSILILLIARAFWRVMDGLIEAAGGRTRRSGPPARSVPMARDPVCGTFVIPETAISLARNGAPLLHFCSERCRDQYVRDGAAGARSHAS